MQLALTSKSIILIHACTTRMFPVPYPEVGKKLPLKNTPLLEIFTVIVFNKPRHLSYSPGLLLALVAHFMLSTSLQRSDMLVDILILSISCTISTRE